MMITNLCLKEILQLLYTKYKRAEDEFYYKDIKDDITSDNDQSESPYNQDMLEAYVEETTRPLDPLRVQDGELTYVKQVKMIGVFFK